MRGGGEPKSPRLESQRNSTISGKNRDHIAVMSQRKAQFRHSSWKILHDPAPTAPQYDLGWSRQEGNHPGEVFGLCTVDSAERAGEMGRQLTNWEFIGIFNESCV